MQMLSIVQANTRSTSKTKGKAIIAFFTVTVEAGVDLVLKQPFLLCYVDHVVAFEVRERNP